MEKQEKTRLVIIACAARKSGGVCRAGDLYLSPAWMVLRKWQRCDDARHVEQTAVFALSARYGLISADKLIETYDERLTTGNLKDKAVLFEQPATELHKRVFGLNQPSSVCLHLPEVYRQTIAEYLKNLQKSGSVEILTGAPGIKLKKLKHWLEYSVR